MHNEFYFIHQNYYLIIADGLYNHYKHEQDHEIRYQDADRSSNPLHMYV